MNVAPIFKHLKSIEHPDQDIMSSIDQEVLVTPCPPPHPSFFGLSSLLMEVWMSSESAIENYKTMILYSLDNIFG